MRKILFFIVAGVSAAIAPFTVFAQSVLTINPNLPGSPGSNLSNSTSTGGLVLSFYNYALFLSGLLAFGAIVYGGIKYAVARGNPSQESDAKQWIWSALLGMLLLAGAYIILYTINPNLVNLTLPGLPSAQVTTGGGSTVPTGGGGASSNGGASLGIPTAAESSVANAALAYKGTSTAGGPANGVLACAWAVNNVLANAGIPAIDADSVPSMEAALQAGRGTQVSPSDAQPGDIVIQAQDGHVGICLNVGCTQVISNSSSKASFSWVSDTSFSPSYTGGPGRIYHLNNP